MVVIAVMVIPPFQHIRILKQISSTPKPFFAPSEMEKSGPYVQLTPNKLNRRQLEPRANSTMDFRHTYLNFPSVTRTSR